MTEELFRQDARLHACSAHITACTDAGIELDRTVFYPLGGGQAGDSGVLVLDDGSPLTIADTRKAKDADGQPTGGIVHVPAAGQETLLARLAPGQSVTARIDAERRQRMMRLHTTTHLLCHVVPHLVNGCSITPDYARLDFAMTDPLDKEQLTAAIAALVAAAYPVTVASISDEELDSNPTLVKSMSVQPPAAPGASAPSALAPKAARSLTCSPAAAPMWPTRPRLAPSWSPKSRRKAPPPAGWCWALPERIAPEPKHTPPAPTGRPCPIALFTASCSLFFS